MKHLDKI